MQPEKISTIEEEHKEDDKLIIKKPNEEEALNEDKINTHSFDFIDYQTIKFVIKSNEQVEVYMVDFESNGICKSGYIERGKLKVWRINEK